MIIIKFQTREERAFAELVAEAEKLQYRKMSIADDDEFGDIPNNVVTFPSMRKDKIPK